MRLLNQSIAEECESLALKQQLGQPVSITISHNSLAAYLCQAGQLDEAQQQALEALAIRERLNDPRLPSTLQILESIAQALGDAQAADEYRRRKEAAHAEAQQRAGQQGLPTETIVALLQLALTVRGQHLDLHEALRAAGADDPAALLAALQRNDPWLATHLQTLATGAPRPTADVPTPYQDLINQVWSAVAD